VTEAESLSLFDDFTARLSDALTREHARDFYAADVAIADLAELGADPAGVERLREIARRLRAHVMMRDLLPIIHLEAVA
jgi:hypothetical protein